MFVFPTSVPVWRRLFCQKRDDSPSANEAPTITGTSLNTPLIPAGGIPPRGGQTAGVSYWSNYGFNVLLKSTSAGEIGPQPRDT